MTRHQNPSRMSTLLLLCAASTACQAPNPAFQLVAETGEASTQSEDSFATQGDMSSQGDSDATGGQTTTTSTTVTSSQTTTDPTSDASATPTTTTDTTNSTSDITSSTSSGSDSTSSTDTTSSTDDTSTQTDEVPPYCEARAGLRSCYAMEKIDNGKIRDWGPLATDIAVSSLSLGPVDTNAASPLDVGAVFTSATVARIAEQTVTGATELGVDMWINPDLVELQGHDMFIFTREREMAAGHYLGGDANCMVRDDDDQVQAAANSTPENGKPFHIACAYLDSGVRVIVNGAGKEFAIKATPNFSATYQVEIGNVDPTFGSGEFVGTLYGLRVWDDISAMVEAIEAGK